MVTQSHRHKTPDTGLPNPSHAPRPHPSHPYPWIPCSSFCYTYFYFVHIIVPRLLASSPFSSGSCGRWSNRADTDRAPGIVKLPRYLDHPAPGGLARCIPSYTSITAANLAHLGGETRASFPPHRNRPHPPPLGQPPCLLDARPDQHNPASYPNKINQDLTQATRETGNSGGTTAV